jgi:hypothetical protein
MSENTTTDIRPRWVHYVKPDGSESEHGACVLAELRPDGSLMLAWYDAPYVSASPHSPDHHFGSWHDLAECRGATS